MSEAKSFTVPWRYESGLMAGQLGFDKYARISTAFAELLSNSFDADASRVDITLETNELGVVNSVTVSDDGVGIQADTIRSRFTAVGIRQQAPGKFGRFGVGRFAVHRIGAISEWTTVAKEADGKYRKYSFRLDDSSPKNLGVKAEDSISTKTGTTITIQNVYAADAEELNDRKISESLLAEFICYLLSHSSKSIWVNGERIDLTRVVETDTADSFSLLIEGSRTNAEVRHLTLKRSVLRSRFPSQLMYCSKGKLVYAPAVDLTLPNNYVVLINCNYLEHIVRTNREQIIEMDPGFLEIQKSAIKVIEDYHSSRENESAYSFIKEARTKPYYPFRDQSADLRVQSEQAVYDVVLQLVNEASNLVGLKDKQRAVIFKLLHRALKNENLIDVVADV